MKRWISLLLGAAMLAAFVGCDTQGETPPELGDDAQPEDVVQTPEEVPGFEWAFDTPENHGMNGEVLDSLHAALEGTQINSLVIVKDGVVVDEYYQGNYDENSVFRFNSCSKSFTSALIGIAIDQGLIEGVDVPISTYFPQVVGTSKEDITIRHLLEHTSGIEWYEFGSAVSFWEMNNADNWVDYILGRPMAATPGTTFTYTTGGTHLLAAILEQVVEGTMLEYATEHLFSPLGMDSVHWRIDPQGIPDGGNGIEMTARDAAKFGQLFLNGGNWESEQLVPESWVDESTSVQVARYGTSYGSYGYQWWIRPFGAGNYDTYYAMGAMGQFILVVPELNLITVMNSSSGGSTEFPYAYFSDYVLAACQ